MQKIKKELHEIVFRNKDITAKNVKRILGKRYCVESTGKKGIVHVYSNGDREKIREKIEDGLGVEILEINP